MPRRELLTAAHRKTLLAFAEEEKNLLQYYTLSVCDLATVREHRGEDAPLLFSGKKCFGWLLRSVREP
jgi:hypothetical protein